MVNKTVVGRPQQDAPARRLRLSIAFFSTWPRSATCDGLSYDRREVAGYTGKMRIRKRLLLFVFRQPTDPMTALIIVLLLIFVPVILVGLYAVSQYNKLVKLDQRYQSLYSDIDVQLQRRHDLVPQLVNTAKGAMKHEEKIFQALADARKQAEQARQSAKANPGDPEAMQNLAAAEQVLDKQISGFMIQVEDNPELKANENMLKLQEQLQTTENKVSFARQAYNDGVRAYNTARESFPTVILLTCSATERPSTLRSTQQRCATRPKFRSTNPLRSPRFAADRALPLLP